MKEKRKSKSGRNPKLDPAVYRYTVRFNEEEHNRFLAMFGKSGVYARSVFLKAHFFGQPFKVLKVDKTLVDYYTKLSDFHAQWKSHATLTLLATQDLPTFGYNMIDPLKSWCWGAILFYPFKNSRFS